MESREQQPQCVWAHRVAILPLLLVALAGRPSAVTANEPYSPKVEMKLGNEMHLELKGKVTGGDLTELVCDAGRTLWFFHTHDGKVYCSKFVNGTAASLETVMEGWERVGNITACLDAAGNPTVVWAGNRSDQEVATRPFPLGERNRSGDGLFEGQVLAASTWTGKAWTAPTILDVLGPGMVGNRLHSLRDAAGTIHVVYDRKLEPPEDYNIGFILGEGFFPNKCFHVYRQGGNWSSPLPTTGSGKFDVGEMRLNNTSDQRLELSLLTELPRQGYVGLQQWNGKTWSPLKQISPTLASVSFYGGGSFLDQRGARITWWSGEDNEYTCVVSVPHESDYRERFVSLRGPIFACHALGIVLLLSPDYHQGELRLWNGRKWTAPMACSPGEYLVGSSSGAVYMARWDRETLVVQEVILSANGSTTANADRGE